MTCNFSLIILVFISFFSSCHFFLPWYVLCFALHLSQIMMMVISQLYRAMDQQWCLLGTGLGIIQQIFHIFSLVESTNIWEVLNVIFQFLLSTENEFWFLINKIEQGVMCLLKEPARKNFTLRFVDIDAQQELFSLSLFEELQMTRKKADPTAVSFFDANVRCYLS